jgi:protein O-mannosyl-transferase
MFNNTDSKLKLILFIVAFLLYANTINHDYAWDDSIVITENPRVQKGISGIPALFLKSNSDYKADKYGYRPIVLTSFAIEFGLFKNKPSVSHFFNVIYFAILCSILFSVLRKIFHKHSNFGPFLVAFLFAIHPIHVEVVANIKSRDEIFALLFSLLSILQILRFYESKNKTALFYSILLFILAFLSKESAITLLGIIPLLLFIAHENFSWKNLIKPTLFLLATGGLAFIITSLSTSSSMGTSLSAGAGIVHESGLQGNSFFYSYNFPEKLANALVVLLLYLKNFFIPIQQLYFYGFNQIPVANWSQLNVYLSVLIYSFLILISVLAFKKNREITFGIWFYFITISIYTHLFRTLADTMADRFLFAPSVGLCILTIYGLAWVLKLPIPSIKAENFLKIKETSAHRFKYILVVMAMLLSYKTFTRNKAWKNNYTLTSTDMPSLENCARAHNYYADNLKNKLITNFTPEVEANMIHHYRRSIQISKESYYAYIGLATHYNFTKRYSQSIALLDTMLSIYPNAADPHYYIGVAYLNTGKTEKAIHHLNISLKLAPQVLNTYYDLSLAYSKNKNFQKALSTIHLAKQKFSESSYIYEALAFIYFEADSVVKSAKYSREMLRFGVDQKSVYRVMIGRLQFKKQDSLAAAYYREAINLGIFKPGEQ